MTATDALEQTLDLISFGWCQDAAARDVNGRATYSHSPNAVQFSLDGALQRATWPAHPFMHEKSDPPWIAAENAAYTLASHCNGYLGADENPWEAIREWNDARGRKKSEVEQLIKEALGGR